MLRKEDALRLRQHLSSRRMQHSLGVSQMAAELAEEYGADIDKARLAGLLHDYARELSPKTLLEQCKTLDIVVSAADREDPVILHAPLGAELVVRDFKIHDQEICHAIACHTTGGIGMSLFDKIIYLADCIEPNRHYPGVDHLRALAKENLDVAVLAAFDHSLLYLIEKKSWIHPNTITARNDLLQQLKNG